MCLTCNLIQEIDEYFGDGNGFHCDKCKSLYNNYEKHISESKSDECYEEPDSSRCVECNTFVYGKCLENSKYFGKGLFLVCGKCINK